jgi:hypothetical protein
MDGNLVVFQLNQPWLISGIGPDATGNNGSFSEPQVITSNVGCRDPDSVLLIPQGLMFKSTQGIYLLSRQFMASYIGIDIAAYNADIISCAQVVNGETQARFLSQLGTSQMYDFTYGTWSPNAQPQGIDAVLDPSGVFTFIRSDWTVLAEASGVYADAGVGFAMLAQTAWLKFDGVNGFQRIWKAFLKGTFYAGQTYQIQIAYDENPMIVDTFTFAPTFNCDTIRIYPSHQLCRAIQFTFQDLAPFATTTTPALDSLDLEVGVRKGGFKRIGAAQSVG